MTRRRYPGLLPVLFLFSLGACRDHGSLDQEAPPPDPIFLSSPGADSLDLPFTEAVRVGDMLYLSGQIGNRPGSLELVPGGIEAETRQTLENIRHHLELAGTGLDKVLKVTVFIVDMDLFHTMNQAYRGFFPADPPARSCVEVASLPDKDALVEIEVIAGG